MQDLSEKLFFSFLILHLASSSPFEPYQTIDLPNRVPSSGIGAACQFHGEQYQNFAFPILLCPIQPALQIILSELQIFFEKLDQHSFQGIHEGFSVRTGFFPFPFEKVAHSPILDSFTFRQRSLET